MIERYRASALVVSGALAATGMFFFVAHPAYHPPNESPMIDLAHTRHYDVASVRRAFASNGLDLSHRIDFSGTAQLSTVAPPWPTTGFYVFVAPAKGKVSWGAEDGSAYEARFGNILVHYGGTDESVRHAVGAAVAALRTR